MSVRVLSASERASLDLRKLTRSDVEGGKGAKSLESGVEIGSYSVASMAAQACLGASDSNPAQETNRVDALSYGTCLRAKSVSCYKQGPPNSVMIKLNPRRFVKGKHSLQLRL